MKILLDSPAFYPSIGGLETTVALRAEGLRRRGHEVMVTTTTAHAGPEPFAFPVVRRPSPRRLLALTRWCTVYYQANLSLKRSWPLLLVRRPWVVSHHSWVCRTDGRIAWQDRLKRRLIRRADASLAVSTALAEDLGPETRVLADPYDDRRFRRLPEIAKDRELAFLGRLVSDKGAELLLAALAELRAGGLEPRLTILGEGPERPALERQAGELGLSAQVTFRGRVTGEAVVEELNRHSILVVPSRYREPFGIVALEALACGCAVVGSAGGGLPEAIGPGGRTFENGDAGALAATLRGLLTEPAQAAALVAGAREHLARHTVDAVTRELEAALRGAVEARR